MQCVPTFQIVVCGGFLIGPVRKINIWSASSFVFLIWREDIERTSAFHHKSDAAVREECLLSLRRVP